jgi:hypothetical protein
MNLKTRFEFSFGQWTQKQGDQTINRARLRHAIDRRDRSIDRLKRQALQTSKPYGLH